VRDGSDQKVLAVGDASRHPVRRLATGDTVMIASVTKAFVATAAMSLVEDGALGLDDSVERWLPGVLSKGRQIKVRHLLSMSSGLPNYEDAPGFPGPGVLPSNELVALIAEQPLRFKPGSQGQQSNSNYAVLQLVLERAGHAPLAELVGKHVVEPAGLTQTTIGGTPTALGYSGDEDVTIRHPRHPSAAAGAVSSVSDVARFLDLLTAGKIPTGLGRAWWSSPPGPTPNTSPTRPSATNSAIGRPTTCGLGGTSTSHPPARSRFSRKAALARRRSAPLVVLGLEHGSQALERRRSLVCPERAADAVTRGVLAYRHAGGAQRRSWRQATKRRGRADMSRLPSRTRADRQRAWAHSTAIGHSRRGAWIGTVAST
jgi:Beta-lactamase